MPSPLNPNELRQLGFAGGLPSGRPVYRHLVSAIERGIVAGTLQSGRRLPAERQLAASLRVSRATIVAAYRELEARGLVRGYVGRGTYVSGPPDASGAPFAWRGKVAAAALRAASSATRDLVRVSTDPQLLSLAAGIPALDRFPFDAFRQALEKVVKKSASAVWGLGSSEGQPRLREAIAHRFGGSPENILVLAGAQQGLEVLARCLIDPGDTIVMDRPGYLGAIQTFRAAGARVIGWDILRHDLDELEDHLVRYRPKLMFTVTTFNNPTGWTMPLRLRRDVLALASRLRVPIIEDNTYGELHLTPTAPAPTLHSLDTQSIVIGLNSFSKMLSPGLRLGWIAAAPPIIEQLALMEPHSLAHNGGQLAVAELLENGAFDEHLVTLRAEHRRRRDALAAALHRHIPDGLLRWSTPDGGLYFWCRLGGRLQSARVSACALAEGVAFTPGEAFYVDHAGERELRICYSSVPAGRSDEAARRLGRAILRARRETSAPPQLVAIV